MSVELGSDERLKCASFADSMTSRLTRAALLPAAALMTNWSGDATSISGSAAMAPVAFRSFPGSNVLQTKCRWQRARR